MTKNNASAWLVPNLISFKGVTGTSCPEIYQNEIEGTVAYGAEIFCDNHEPVFDKYGVAHKPIALYPEGPSLQSIMDCFSPDDTAGDYQYKIQQLFNTVPKEEPKVEWADPRVKMVYDLICDDEDTPPVGNHWEGWLARRIVENLFPVDAEPQVTINRSDLTLLMVMLTEQKNKAGNMPLHPSIWEFREAYMVAGAALRATIKILGRWKSGTYPVIKNK